MGQNLNSSGARERFTLCSVAPANAREYTQPLGDNYVQAQCVVDEQAASSMTIKLQTSEDGSSWTDVGSALTVVPCGSGVLNGAVGKFFRFLITGGTDQIMVQAQFRNIAQLVGAPS